MATHLSESSVNSLLRLINQADTSASYNEKVDLLKKSGILAGDTEYSIVLNKEALILDLGDDDLNSSYTVVSTFYQIAKAMLAGLTDPEERKTLLEHLTAIAQGQIYTIVLGDSTAEIQAYRRTVSQFMLTAAQFDRQLGTPTAAAILGSGIASAVAWLYKSKDDPTFSEDTKTKIGVRLDELQDWGFDTTDIAYSTSNRLNSFFTDGLYNFTYITYPTKTLVNGISGTGSGLISSYKDIYTNRVVKKELDQTAIPSFTLKLQSFDIMTKYITMATNGSSSVGKFRFISDTICNVMYNGYSSLFGKFYTCKTVIQKTPLGFAIKSSIVNLDHSTTLYYAALYTRVSLPLDKIETRLLVLPTDGDGKIARTDGIRLVGEELAGVIGENAVQLFMAWLTDTLRPGRVNPSEVISALKTLLVPK